MGRSNDPMAVLDSRLRVRGVQGLRVVDAGAMPTITSGNTNSPTLMLAEKAAEWIRADYQASQGINACTPTDTAMPTQATAHAEPASLTV